MAALTTDYRVRVLARIQKDPEFAAALVSEALQLFMEGHATEALSIMRKLANAVGFEVLGEALGKNPKTLHRQLSPHGNPTMRATSEILRELTAQVVGKPVHIELHAEAVTVRASARETAYA